MKLYRVTDNHKHTIFYVGNKPQVRKYKLEAEQPEMVVVEEFEYEYKWQIIVLLNDALKTGKETRHEPEI